MLFKKFKADPAIDFTWQSRLWVNLTTSGAVKLTGTLIAVVTTDSSVIKSHFVCSLVGEHKSFKASNRKKRKDTLLVAGLFSFVSFCDVTFCSTVALVVSTFFFPLSYKQGKQVNKHKHSCFIRPTPIKPDHYRRILFVNILWATYVRFSIAYCYYVCYFCSVACNTYWNDNAWESLPFAMSISRIKSKEEGESVKFALCVETRL